MSWKPFKAIGRVVGAVAGAALGGPIGAMIGGGLATAATGGNLREIATTGLLSWGGAHLGNALTSSIGGSAASAAGSSGASSGFGSFVSKALSPVTNLFSGLSQYAPHIGAGAGAYFANRSSEHHAIPSHNMSSINPISFTPIDLKHTSEEYAKKQFKKQKVIDPLDQESIPPRIKRNLKLFNLEPNLSRDQKFKPFKKIVKRSTITPQVIDLGYPYGRK